MPHNSWQLIHSQALRDYRVLRARNDRYLFKPTGAEADYLVCDSADWVLVIPLTEDGRVVFVRQYRHATRQVVLEVPGGIMDQGESPRQTAARELEEETGYKAERIQLLDPVLPNPALNTASCHIAVAHGCVRAGQVNLDPFEQIEIVLRGVDEIPQMIRSGEMRHALTIVALALAGVGVKG